MSRPVVQRALATALPLIAAAAVALTIYRPTLEYGFRYDDYHLVRPLTLGEVTASFTGTWDPHGVMVPFYRPLIVAFHALRFHWLHLDARSHHLVSVASFILIAGGLGWFVLRVTHSVPLGVVAAAFVAAHPGMPAGAVAWITNQMHLLQLLTFLLAVLWWTGCRTRPARWWTPLLVLQVVAFLIKEDGVMLFPVIVALHVIHGACAESRWSRPPISVLVAGAVSIALLVWWRNSVLGGLGGYHLPSGDMAWRNYWRGLSAVFLQQPPDRAWQPLLAVLTIAVLPAGAVLMFVRPAARRAGVLLFGGVAVAALYDLPFALVTKSEQYYMLAAGAALALTGAVGTLASIARNTASRVLVAALAGAIALAMAAVARDITRDFAPYAPYTLATDEIVLSWAGIPPELREFLQEKRARWTERGQTLQLTHWLDVATYGLYDEESESDGRRFRWTSDRVQFYVRCTYDRLQAQVRPLHPDLGRRGVGVTITVDRIRATRVALSQPTWTGVDVTLPPCAALRVSSTRQVELLVDRTWSPAKARINPADRRELGVMLRDVRWLDADAPVRHEVPGRR